MNCLGNKRGETLMKHAKNYKIKEFVISKSDWFGSGILIRIIGLFVNSPFSFLPSYCVIINHLHVIMTTILTNYDYIWLYMTWLFMTKYAYVWLSMTIYDHVCTCMPMHDNVWLFMTAYDS